MNYITQIVLVTLLVITAVLSTSLAATGEVTQTEATVHRRQQNVHLNRQHHNHHHHHQRKRLDNNQKRERPQNAAHPDENFEFIDDAAHRQHQQQQQQQLKRNVTTTTRLRRMGARDYYNKVTQRRLQTKNGAVGRTNEWSYNNYNVHTNTFSGPSYNSGKGDDNTQDVEVIGANSNNNEWNGTPRHNGDTGGSGYMPRSSPPRRYDPVTTAPPPLVPARRGYDIITPAATESPATEANSIDRSSVNDPSDMERRHICVQQRTVQMPVKTTEVYTRPIWKHISTPCQPQTHVNQMCTRVQLVHEPAYRDVIRHTAAQQLSYDCCAGWTRETPHTNACMKPICSTRCQNGGSCMSPDLCSCPAGFTGRYCEHDINECKEDKPCDHNCINTVGSYYCRCREGFVLQADQQSCKKFDLHDDDAFEARDMENEIESHDNMAARLQKIERSLANERVQTNELEKSLQATYHVVDSLKGRLNTLEKQQQDLNRLQTNLYATETRTNKLEGMLNVLMKCRNGPNAYCP